MPVALLMPALSPTMTEGNIAKWIKKVGDEIVSGDIIAEVETDKATMEVEAVDEGKLASIIFPAGAENVPVNKLIGVIALDGETEGDIEQFINNNTDAKTNSEINADKEDNSVGDKSVNVQVEEKKLDDKQDVKNLSAKNIPAEISAEKRVLISPLAKRISQIKGIDISNIKGNISNRDVGALNTAIKNGK